MALNILGWSDIVERQVTAIQSRFAGLMDLAIGSILRALAESNAGVVTWLQSLIVQLLAMARAATCSGTDLDSWMADFGFVRLSAVQSTGTVLFSRFTPGSQAVIPVGFIVQTGDGSEQFSVTLDTSNPAYNATLGGYVLSIGVSSITVPVQADTAGAAGNVLANTITTIVSALSGVDTVTNAAAFVNGEDAEIDSDFRSRFVSWVASLSKATKAAIGYALASMQQGVTYTLTENQDYNGNTLYGYFYAVVDDGSGAPGSSFLASAAAAIEAVRGFTIRYGVFPPSVQTANVSMSLVTDASGDHASLVSQVSAAIQVYIAGLKLGQLLPYSQLSAVAYGVSPLITNVTGVTLNGGTADMPASQKQVTRAGIVQVT